MFLSFWLSDNPHQLLASQLLFFLRSITAQTWHCAMSTGSPHLLALVSVIIFNEADSEMKLKEMSLMSISTFEVVIGDVADKFKLLCQRVHAVTVTVCRRPDSNRRWLTPALKATDLYHAATTLRQIMKSIHIIRIIGIRVIRIRRCSLLLAITTVTGLHCTVTMCH